MGNGGQNLGLTASQQGGKMVQYDSKVIQEFAQALYNRAAWVIFVDMAIYGCIGLVAGGITKGTMGAVVGGIIGLVIGFNTGSGKAFQYKLQAQTALCQAKIEQNTSS